MTTATTTTTTTTGSHSLALDVDGGCYSWGIAHACGQSIVTPILQPSQIRTFPLPSLTEREGSEVTAADERGGLGSGKL